MLMTSYFQSPTRPRTPSTICLAVSVGPEGNFRTSETPLAVTLMLVPPTSITRTFTVATSRSGITDRYGSAAQFRRACGGALHPGTVPGKGSVHQIDGEPGMGNACRSQATGQTRGRVKVRIGVHLQQIRLPGWPDAKINSGIIPAAEQAKRLPGQGCQPLSQPGRNLGRITGRRGLIVARTRLPLRIVGNDGPECRILVRE